MPKQAQKQVWKCGSRIFHELLILTVTKSHHRIDIFKNVFEIDLYHSIFVAFADKSSAINVARFASPYTSNPKKCRSVTFQLSK